jgi:hypothetical protein
VAQAGAADEGAGDVAEPAARLGGAASGVELERRLEALRLGDDDAFEERRLEDGGAELAAVLVDPGGVLAGGGADAVDDEPVDDEVGVDLVLDGLDGAHEVADAVGGVLVGLDDEHDAVARGDGDLEPEAEGRGRVDDDDVDAVGDALAEDAAPSRTRASHCSSESFFSQ